jgi:hypothetical protein
MGAHVRDALPHLTQHGVANCGRTLSWSRRRLRRLTARPSDPAPPDAGVVTALCGGPPAVRAGGWVCQGYYSPAARGRFMRDPLVRISDLPQRATLVAGLPTRTPPRPAPQRLRRRLGQAVRRRRTRRVRRILPKTSPQVRVLRPQHRVLLTQPGVVPLKLNNPRLQPSEPLKQLHDGRRSGQATMIQPRRRRSNQPADEHLISHGSTSKSNGPIYSP